MPTFWPTLLTWLLFLGAHALSWGAIIHALLHKRDPRSALGWTVTALFLPGVGALIYFIFGIGRAESRAARLMRVAGVPAASDRSLHGGPRPCAPPGDLSAEALPLAMRRKAHLGRTLTGRRLAGGNNLTPLYDGEQAYPVMLNAIHTAQHHVFMTTYIFKGGIIGEEFIQALSAAAARNVDVRLIIDGLGGTLYSWTRPWRVLKKKGVKVAQFLPPSLDPFNLSVNLRNHRKVLVCDGTGFTGGMNIADENWYKSPKFSVQDIHFCCQGPIVAQLQEAFLLDWGFISGVYEQSSPMHSQHSGAALCRMVLDGPGSGKDPLHDLYCGSIATAERSVCIMTPYFLPTHEMIASLKTAALHGACVRIIMPAKNNLRYVQWASWHLLPQLIEAGVEFYLRPAPFAHTKLLIIDTDYTQVGSANLDPRSLRLNFELNIECFDPTLALQLNTHFENVRQSSQPIDLEYLQARPLLYKIRNAACWIFSPYL
ncbi:MAG: phospholipase D-like domain-containing protein [Desulfovibrionaceae bacterium]